MNSDKKHVIDRRAVRLEKVMSKDFIPFLSGRPLRETVIAVEDLLNLTIALNTSSSLDDFLLKV